MEIDKLPRLICGPILRRVDDQSVTVWLVLKRNNGEALQSPVELKVSKKGGIVVMIGSAVPTTIGRLLVVAVRAIGTLVPGETYDYRVRYRNDSVFSDQKDEDNDIEARDCNFVYMPAKLGDVRIAHASCRKPDGQGRDALAALYREIQAGRVARPHLLLLTGDQIYADGVAGPLLFMIMDAMPALLGELTDQEASQDKDLEPYCRIPLLGRASIYHSYKPESHLVWFREYFLMHLFVWSEALWGDDLPTMDVARDRLFDLGTDFVRYTDAQHKQWEDECAALRQFRADLPAVRSLLRSTPTLMIFDDHEVTDDWRLNERWIKDVIGSRIGKRLELNALLAYILAQASGNDAGYFNPLIADIFQGNDVAAWREREGSQPGIGLANLLHWQTPYVQQRAIQFHYQVEQPACNIVVLDTRTRRAFKRGLYPSLIDEDCIDDEIGGSNDMKPLLLVSPPPLFGHLVTEVVQATFAENRELSRDVYEWLDADGMRRIRDKEFDPMLNVDAEAWSLERQARVDLVSKLCKAYKNAPFIVVLSGDIHYAYTASISLEEPEKQKIVQLTSSAILNQEGKSLALGLVRPDALPGWTILSKELLRFEGALRYRVEMHKATSETAWSNISLPARIFLGLVTPLGKVEQAKYALRNFDTYVGTSNNCGLIAFPRPGELTHTLITESLGESAYIAWIVPV